MFPTDWRPVLLVGFFGLIASSFADKCAAPPLNLPYRNVSITPGVLTQGISVSIGTPWQHIALTPSLQLDTTFIPRFTNTCVSTTSKPSSNSTRRSASLVPRDGHPGAFEENSGRGGSLGWEGSSLWVQCAETYGGAFNPNLSTTFHDNGTNNQIQEWWLKKVDFADWHFITETFTFSDYLSLYTIANDALPDKSNLTTSFILPDENKTFGGLGSSLLGLSPNSTLLAALHTQKIIPSTSWTLTNDSLCLGCIDTTSYTGTFQTFKPADKSADPSLPCVLQTKIEALNFHPKSDIEGATLIQESFTACIDPGVKFFVLPPDARKAFKEIVGEGRSVQAEYDDFTSFSGPPKQDVGILTFRLETGLEVNVSISGVGAAGAEENGLWRLPVGKGAWGAYGNSTWTLGKPFTDAVVLRWDASSKEFGIAQRNQDKGTTKDIQPLGCTDFPKIETSVTSSPGTGVLVGGIIGGFVAGLFFCAAALWFFKRGEKGVKAKYASLDGTDTMSMRSIPRSIPTTSGHHGAGAGSMGDTTALMAAGALSPPPPSIRESLRSQAGSPRPASWMEPQLVGDSAIYEAPEGGTRQPTKRERMEMAVWGEDSLR